MAVMRALYPFALGSLLLSGGAQAHSPWPAKDAWQHLGASAGLAAGGYGLSSLVFEDRSARLLTGGGLALGLGTAKELYDLWGPGVADWRDMGWNVAGTGLGLLLAWGVDRLFFEKDRGASAVLSGRRSLGLAVRF
jgi:uncharacterized protein YfiM (DUF2279 family)